MSSGGDEVSELQAAEPFLKWAGGKRGLLEQLLPRLPGARDGQYFEPFLGGGAVFFALAPSTALLSDINPGLTSTYRIVRDRVDDVIDVLAGLQNSETKYYEIRDWRPSSSPARAARFVYLNKTCFNGLYRENLEGRFNVPYGMHRYDTVVCDEEQLKAASHALQHASVRTLDFVAAIREAKAGDTVYFDPPYITSHRNNGFVEYNARVFSWKDQRRLLAAAERLVDRQVQVAISNADHASIRRLYRSSGKFTIYTLKRWSTMASQASRRYATTELLIVNRRR